MKRQALRLTHGIRQDRAVAAILLRIGLSPVLAHGLARWDDDASRSALFDDRRELSRLIGRPTTPLAESVRQALKG